MLLLFILLWPLYVICVSIYIFIINEMLSELSLLGMSTCFIFLTDYLCLCTGTSVGQVAQSV
jgi:hypothetical protein